MSVAVLADPVAAPAPAEVRGLGREDVAMLVATRGDGALVHARFPELSSCLVAGDLLVINTSATVPAALPARLGGRDVALHLSTSLVDERWVVELRTSDRLRFGPPPIGARLELPGRAHAELLAPYLGSDRLCVARLALGQSPGDYLGKHGRPIRYAAQGEDWPDRVCRGAGEQGSRGAPRCRAPAGLSPQSS